MSINTPLLNSILSPKDLKNFSLLNLIDLSREIRQKIIFTLSKRGGHLASNLGTVELTIALHYVFNSPEDKIIFDVGHQAYTHKLLTGRNNELFDNIRSDQGLSGFTNPLESPHDLFYSGHAGNALSLALGITKQDFCFQRNYHVIPVIGDAALSCGLTLEALNNLSKNLKKFIIILNDNEMSISKNVGKISQILNKLLNSPTSTKLSDKFEQMIKKIPVCGETLIKSSQNVSLSIKNLFCDAPFFEQFGLSYIGPINGHDIKKLITIFSAIKDSPSSIIVHIKTIKGKGVIKAQKEPGLYHGVSSFSNPITCELPVASKETFPKIFGEYICELAKTKHNLAVVTPAMCLGSSLTNFSKLYPNRFFDVGIAEGHAVTFSAGLAKLKNVKVICSIYSTFLLRAVDNVFHDVCLQNIPVIFCIDRAGLAFSDGQSHHGIYDLGFLRSFPNMIICQPRNGQILKELIAESFNWNSPCAIRYPNIPTYNNNSTLQKRPLGKAEILVHGNDLLIIALGHMVDVALIVKDLLKQIGIFATVVDPIFVKPLDANLLSHLLCFHSKIVTLEEHSIKTGLGAEFNEFIITHNFTHANIMNIGIPDTYVQHGKKTSILNNLNLTPEKIFKKLIVHFSLSTNKKNPITQ